MSKTTAVPDWRAVMSSIPAIASRKSGTIPISLKSGGSHSGFVIWAPQASTTASGLNAMMFAAFAVMPSSNRAPDRWAAAC